MLPDDAATRDGSRATPPSVGLSRMRQVVVHRPGLFALEKLCTRFKPGSAENVLGVGQGFGQFTLA